MANCLLVDGSNLYHRVFHSTNDVGSDGLYVYLFINSIYTVAKKANLKDIVVFWDYPVLPVEYKDRGEVDSSFCKAIKDQMTGLDIEISTDFRRDLQPQYKANRAKRPKAFYRMIKHIVSATSVLGMENRFSEYLEADDLIAHEVRKRVEQGDTGIIYSADKDFYPLLNYFNIKSPYKDDIIKPVGETYEEHSIPCCTLFKHNFPVVMAPLVRSIINDSSDNLYGIPRLSRKKLKDFFFKYYVYKECPENSVSMPEFLEDLDSGSIKFFYKKKVLEERELLLRNYYTIKLYDFSFPFVCLSKKDMPSEEVYKYFRQLVFKQKTVAKFYNFFKG